MAIRNIVKEGDPILTKTCRPVEKFDEKLAQLLDDMKETMYMAEGVGLAGPQVGVLRRVVVIDIGEGLIELVNPKIVIKSGIQHEQEGCLSCPGDYGVTERPMNVTVRAFNRFGEPVEYTGSDLLARAFCHEIDHLNGVLFKERLVKQENA